MSVAAASNRVAVSVALWLAALLLATLCGAASAAEQPSGASLYRNHCAACHGADAEGDGPAAAAMKTKVPSLRTLAQRNRGVYPADAVTRYIDGRERPAAHGNLRMPIWGEIFAAPSSAGGEEVARERIAALVEYIATLQR
jgi:mono/diheme cytochrome c family protein